MNTVYQNVAAGAITPDHHNLVSSTDEREILNYQENRDFELKKIKSSRVMVEVTTELPSYQSLGKGAWRNQLVERVYKSVAKHITRRLRQLNPKRYSWHSKTAIIHLVWDRLHHNDSGKPVYVQRWYIERAHAALLGHLGRLGEEVFADTVLAAWHEETVDVQAWRTHDLACAC